MGHNTPEFEIVNAEGESRPINGTTSATIGNEIPLPAAPDKIIESFWIQNDAPIDDEGAININSEIEVSIDGGVSFKKIFAGHGFHFDTREIKQFLLRSNVANCPFSSIIKFEKFDEDA